MDVKNSVMPQSKPQHVPVMLEQVVEAIKPHGKIIIDGTFGAGGYTRAFLERGAQVIALDRDPSVRPWAEELIRIYGHALSFHKENFSAMEKYKGALVDAVVLDLGVSTMQLQSARGFSFKIEGDLDMRMGDSGIAVKDFLKTATEKNIAQILWQYGEEPYAKRVAKAIVEARKQNPITTSKALATLIHQTIGARRKDKDSATQTFQALRIHVNDELGELKKGLQAARRCLKTGGILAVISFHSLEDRIVKQFLKEGTGQQAHPNKHLPPMAPQAQEKQWAAVWKKQKPTEAEVRINPPSRSALLRVAIAC